jgi:hypothetical protein
MAAAISGVAWEDKFINKLNCGQNVWYINSVDQLLCTSGTFFGDYHMEKYQALPQCRHAAHQVQHFYRGKSPVVCKLQAGRGHQGKHACSFHVK